MGALNEIIFVAKRLGHELKSSLRFDPLIFPELSIPDYEQYHERSLVSDLSRLRIKLISDWIEPGSTVLDVGCGEGFVAEEISKAKAVKVYGIDVSAKAMSKFVSKGFYGEVRDIDRDGLNLKSTYDYILFVEVLEHLKWPHKVLVEACKHAKKGVIVTLPNSGYIRWRLQMLRGYFPRQSFTHLHFWSINDFELFLKALGLRVLDFKADVSGRINCIFKNFLAYQQCWLIAPKSSPHQQLWRRKGHV